VSVREAKGRPRTEGSGGASWRVRSVAILTAATRPDQVVGLAVLGIEQVGADGSVEARIVGIDLSFVAPAADLCETNAQAADLRYQEATRRANKSSRFVEIAADRLSERRQWPGGQLLSH
jgi:hypothetical protein